MCKLKEKIGASNLFSRVSNFLLRTMEQLVEKYAEGNHVHEEKIAELVIVISCLAHHYKGLWVGEAL